MNNRTVMVIIAAFIMVGMVSPMFVQGSDALGPGDYYITIPAIHRHGQRKYNMFI